MKKFILFTMLLVSYLSVNLISNGAVALNAFAAGDK